MKKINGVFLVISVTILYFVFINFVGWLYRNGTTFNLSVMSFVLSATLFPAGIFAYWRIRKDLLVRPQLKLVILGKPLSASNEIYSDIVEIVSFEKILSSRSDQMYFQNGFTFCVINDGNSPSHDYRITLFSDDKRIEFGGARSWRRLKNINGLEWFKDSDNNEFAPIYPGQLLELAHINISFPFEGESPNGQIFQLNYEIQSHGVSGSEKGILNIRGVFNEKLLDRYKDK